MTHEYVIALGGRVEPRGIGPGEPPATAVAWAADRVLAVGTDDAVRSISRGDSTFLDLGGCVVTPLPDDLAHAEAALREEARPGAPDRGIGAFLIEAGMLDATSALEPGAPADLAFWDTGAGPPWSEGGQAPRLLAVVRGGAFTAGDEHRGPFTSRAASR